MKRLSFLIFRLISFNSRKFLIFGFFLLAFNFASMSANAQTDTSEGKAPPPIKFISKDEARQLDAEKDIKKRTKLALDLMEIRLKKAEELNSQQRFDEMFQELGGFNALIDKILDFLDSRENGGKVLSNFKRVEMTLRAFLPRIELIRRELPERYEFYVRDLGKSVRNARARAIEPMFSDTVVKDNTN